MASSNRDRVGQMFTVVAPALETFIDRVMGTDLPVGTTWIDLVAAADGNNGMEHSSGDPAQQLKFLTKDHYTLKFKPGWKPFRKILSRTDQAYASELLQVRHSWAHMKPFTDDDAYRALDTAERLLGGIGDGDAADAVKTIRLNLRRVTADKDDRRALKAAADLPESSGLRPWREVLQPHNDVATGNFHASEFAADLYKVATGSETDSDYADPVEFFRRTYLTEGLHDLLGRAVRRLSGDGNASPVINLQTNFGGGKTHSMLALWHVAAGRQLGDFPQDVQELLAANGYRPRVLRRVAIVGNHLSPDGSTKSDGTTVNTLWGEMAWQLSGREAFELVSGADAARTPPGQALHDLLARYAPAVILIDEWVAYARSLVGRDDLAAGTFEDQFTFAQQLTEVAKSTPGILLAISIPASEVGSNAGPEADDPAGNAQEVGGTSGIEALRRLQNVVRRVADQWRPASAGEAYDIVKRRLFTDPDGSALAAIGATARAFVQMYRENPDDFPRETRGAGYEERIRRCYPIHPELFDTLYEEWSSLERFQRTRGVLRLMSEVIHALWRADGDASPLIMPGSIPLASARVNSELTQYLHDSWKAIVDADVDGSNSEPVRIDTASRLFGQRHLTVRLARTVFFGSAPTIGSAHKGIDRGRVFLGTAAPGDTLGNFHAALTRLGDRATYFYSGAGKYWYDVHANVTRTARDQAGRLHREDVWAEIARRLGNQLRHPGDFARVHVCPEDNGDIPDGEEARLVILHPKTAHKRGLSDSAAVQFSHEATEHKGAANRVSRNMVVFLAPDTDRLEELDSATRDYLGWQSVLKDNGALDLTDSQRAQARERLRNAEESVASRLLQTFIWALVPAQPDPGAPFTMRVTKSDGQSAWLAERVSRKLGADGDLATQQAAAAIRQAINRIPKIWESGHVSLGELWKLYCTYPYMPRLRDRRVLEDGIHDLPLLWQQDAFALAAGYDAAAGRYVGLWIPGDPGSAPPATDALLVVRPDVAVRQRATEEAGSATPDATVDGGSAASGAAGASATPTTPIPTGPGPSGLSDSPKKTRFFGVKQLNSDRIAMDFKDVADEILAHLREEGTQLTVRIEVEATKPAGFEESQVRTVSENAATLKFGQSGFEES